MEITKDIRYIGVDDHDIDLFEGQYDVSENGTRRQDIEIYYSFVGKIDLPE